MANDEQGNGGAAAELLGNPPAAPAAGDSTGAPPAGDWWAAMDVSAEKPAADQLSDAEWLGNKKFAGFADMVKSARALETRLGAAADRVAVPKGPDDKEGWAALAKAMGVPDSPDGYKIELPGTAGDDPLLQNYAAKAHELGVPPHMAQGLAQWLGEQLAEQGETSAAKARTELQAAWSGDYDARIEQGRRAMAQLELTPDDVNQMAAGYGLAKTMKMLASIGARMGEDGGLPGHGSGGARTPEQLQARKAEIMADKEQAGKLMAGDPTLKAEWDAIIAAEAAAMDKQRQG